ncbi:MAG: sialidase family protein [Planctomycetota bacterium]|jgi:hypothetical protein
MLNTRAVARAGLFAAVLTWTASSGAAAEGVRVIRDFEEAEMAKRWPWPGHCAYGKAVKDRVAHGEYSLKCAVPSKLKRYCQVGPVAKLKAEPRQMAVPPNRDYHDTLEWYFERYCPVVDDAYASIAHKPEDWSGYAALRFDVYAEDAPLVLAMSVRDATGPRFHVGWTGMRSGKAIFNVPKGTWVTCEFPLAEMIRVGELDATRMIGFYLHHNGYGGDTAFYLDYARLVKTGAEASPAHEVVKPRGKPGPRLHRVVRTPPLERDAAKLKRRPATAEAFGPITASERGSFGGLGVTYYNTVRRGVVAYDAERILFLSRGGGDGASRKINPESDTAGGIYAHASFDGGRTWGGIEPGEKLPTHLNTWYGRAGASSDCATGAVYMIGTENCQSYHGGYDTYFRTLGFTGEKWAPERVSMIDANMQKCPFWCHALRLKSGRIWAVWCDGRSSTHYPTKGGFPFKYSDDGGLTWSPSKNGDSAEVPRPLYRPSLGDLEKAHEKAPSRVVLLPAQLTTGPMMAPFGETLIAVNPAATKWAVQAGEGFTKWKDIPPFGKTARYSECSVTSVEGKHFFAGRGGRYGLNDYAKNIRRKRTTMEKIEAGMQTDLAVAHYDGEKWDHAVLEEAGVWDSVLVASGERVFCFYAKVEKSVEAGKKWVVLYRRWADGKWAEAVKVAEDPVRLNRLAAPRRCPPDFAVVLWDHTVAKGEDGPAGIKFARVPNK